MSPPPSRSACLGLFAKRPHPGRVKTRLVPRLGAEGAAALYRCFLEDTLNLARRSSARHCRIWWAGEPDADASHGFAVSRQSEGDLGARLAAAFDDAAALGELPLLVLGTDSPDLPAGHVEAALDALDAGADLVLGAATDGGVWCIGLARPVPGLMDELPWSVESTGDALRARADALGLRRVEVDAWTDCDEPEDLEALWTRLQPDPERAIMTWRWLRERTAGTPRPEPPREP